VSFDVLINKIRPAVFAVGDDKKQQAKLSLGQPTVLPHCTFGVTWRHLSRYHLIAYMPFHIGGPLEPSLYL